MAKPPRPRTLAAGFGVFFLVVGIVAWQFSRGLTAPWFPADTTRWILTTYMLVAAIFLVGLGGLGLSVRSSFSRQIREVDGRLGTLARELSPEALPPPLPEAGTLRDTVDRDIDELLESLSEVEATAARDAQVLDSGGDMRAASYGVDDVGIGAKRERLVRRRKFLGRYLLGPGLVAAIILGFSGMMLPGADSFAQFNYQLNAALILGIAYSWVGVGCYIAATVYGLVGGGRE